MSKLTFIEQEFLQALPLPLMENNYQYPIKLQLASQYGKTKFLNISESQAKQIEKILFTTTV